MLFVNLLQEAFTFGEDASQRRAGRPVKTVLQIGAHVRELLNLPLNVGDGLLVGGCVAPCGVDQGLNIAGVGVQVLIGLIELGGDIGLNLAKALVHIGAELAVGGEIFPREDADSRDGRSMDNRFWLCARRATSRDGSSRGAGLRRLFSTGGGRLREGDRSHNGNEGHAKKDCLDIHSVRSSASS